jgi:FolB domain-containing protein
MHTQTCKLRINALKLDVFLGWTEQEREQQQSVLVDIHIQFPKVPAACMSDELEDTYCYDNMIKQILQAIGQKHYRLVEHLTHTIYQTIKLSLPNDTLIGVGLTKHPSIDGLTGGVCFHYGECF